VDINRWQDKDKLMNVINFIMKNFWVAFILVTFINAAVFKYRSISHVEADPSLAPGYSKLLRGFLFWANFPWVVMGIGIVYGGIPTVFHFFRPQDGNPFVLAFFCSIFLIWVLGTVWLFFRNGAETLINHPGFLRGNPKNPAMIKAVWVIGLAGGILAVIMMYTQNLQVPNF